MESMVGCLLSMSEGLDSASRTTKTKKKTHTWNLLWIHEQVGRRARAWGSAPSPGPKPTDHGTHGAASDICESPCFRAPGFALN